MNQPVRIVNRRGPGSVAKAIVVLRAVVERPEAVGLSELSRTVGFDKATTLRLVTALMDGGLVVQGQDRRYAPGLELDRLGELARGRRTFAVIVQPWLVELSAATGEAAVAGVLDGAEMVNVGHVAGSGELRIGRSAGERWPIHVSASGKAIAAALDPARLAAVLDRCDFGAFTDRTIVDRAAFERHLDEVRSRGWAAMVEERTPGVSSVAAAVMDGSHAVVGAIGVVGWTGRLTGRAQEAAAAAVVAASRKVAHQMGSSTTPDTTTEAEHA